MDYKKELKMHKRMPLSKSNIVTVGSRVAHVAGDRRMSVERVVWKGAIREEESPIREEGEVPSKKRKSQVPSEEEEREAEGHHAVH